MSAGAPGSSLRIVILDSWTRDPATGSGTAAGVAALAAGLESLGHRVRRAGPPLSGRTLLRRLRYNAALVAGPELPGAPGGRTSRGEPGEGRGPDLVVGVDFDGCVAALPDDVPYVVALKGIRADEARFESGASRLRLYVLSHLEALNAGRADAVVVPSRYSARRAARLYRIPPDRLRVVPEPLELERWWASRGSRVGSAGGCGGGAGGLTVLSVARQYPRKNTVGLVAAFEGVARRRDDVRLRIVGGGPELPRVRREVSRRGLEERVEVAGALPDHADVRRAYREADVFALPSRQEGFGIVFLEAMAAGLAIVGSTAGAVPEVVARGETGLLVDPDDREGLTRALLRLLDDAGLRRRLGEAGRRRVRRYDAPAVAREFVEAAFPAPGAGGGER